MEDQRVKLKIMMHPLNRIIQPDRNNEEVSIGEMGIWSNQKTWVLISTEQNPKKVEATNSASLRIHRKAVYYSHQI